MKALLPITGENISRCVDFLASYEYRCVSLMSYLIEDGKVVFPSRSISKYACLSARDSPQKIEGILLLSRSGILLHCLANDIDTVAYASAVGAFLARLPIQCIIGDKTGNQFLESLIKIEPSSAIDYRLMTLETLPHEGLCALGDHLRAHIRRAAPEDTEMILPLQEGYELEEVVPPGGPFNREACRLNLESALKKQFVYLAMNEDRCIAKAGTNARGLNWDQLGGIFTLPKWRGRGVGSALVAYTARERILANRKVTLFVKETNVFAQKAYLKAGFLQKTMFRLSYYQL